ncbi:MAG: RluA family pseudouridine synthase [Muribaculaceae bacterium]|nr:RluA family pseudouridine synthase [Muribaculaceae bacterium]
MEVVYEDNHIIVVNKAAGELVQGDRTGDVPLVETLKQWIKEKYAKPGNVFCGVVHRIDRPTSGLVVFARTSKGLSRMNELLRRGEVHKTYWAITTAAPPQRTGTLTHWLTSVERNNKTYASPTPVEGASKAVMNYRLLASGDRYHLLEVELITGRKHQIRCQLAAIGCPVKGDLKYGAPRSNPDGGICLQSHRIQFTHPVSQIDIDLTAPLPPDPLWATLAQLADGSEQTQQAKS